MSRLSMVGVSLVACLAAIGGTSPASAGECRVACTRAKQVCVTAIKQAKTACRQDCANARDTGSPGGGFPGCLGACRDDFMAAKATCKSAFAECRDACLPGGGDGGGGGGGGGGTPGCADQCGAQGRDCFQGVRDQGLACGSDCQTTAHAALAACRTSANPFMCMLDAGRALARCVGGCAESGLEGARSCNTDLHACLSACGGGSPSAAFVP